MEVTKANLATYLAGLTPSVTPYPIEITETVASDWVSSGISGRVGNIINTNTPNGVYLDLGLTIIPSSVTIMNSAFYGCTSLTTAPTIPSSVTNMESTFYGCTSLTTAPTIPPNVISLYYTFYGCTSLTTAPTIPSSVTNMERTFYNCTSLTTAPTIPSSVTNMNRTFSGCTSLTTAPTIPSSVTNMESTFYGCTLLHTIQNFAVDVDNCIMTGAFGNCPALANIYVTTLSESSWHLLHTDTDATGTDYTIYNPDGTVAGSGTVAGTSQVLTLYGKSDELVISDNITPTLAVETATSQVQWHKSGLPYDDELMIFNAKNPDTVISNFITVNRAGEEFLGNASTATTAQTATLADRAKDSYPIPTDAVLQYSFDEIGDVIIDNSYSESHAENHGVIPVDGVCGKAGYFNNSYMIAPRPSLGDDITIYFWAKFDALGLQTIVQSRTAVGSGLTVIQITNLYRLDWRENVTTFTGYTPPVNTWHHVCMKMNATTKVLKINGETKVTLTGTYGTTTNLASTIWAGMIGTGGTPYGSPLTGSLDGLKIVPRFTTDDEDTGEYKARANHPKFYATADKWKTARNITISDADGTNTGTAVSVDGSANKTLKLPATIKATLSGNASTATKLATARKIGSVDFDGSANISLGQILAIPNIKIQTKPDVAAGNWTFPNPYSSWVFVFWTTDTYWGSATNGISSCFSVSGESVYSKGSTLSVCTAPVSSPSQWHALAIGV